MGVEVLIEKIDAKARIEAEQIVAEGTEKAKEAAKAITDAAQKKAEEIVSRAKLNAEISVRAAAGEDEINERIEILNCKRKLMDKAIEDAKKAFAGIDIANLAKGYTKYVKQCGFSDKVEIVTGGAFVKMLTEPSVAKTAFGFEGNLLEYWTKELGVSFSLSDKKAKDGEFVACSEIFDVDLGVDALFEAAYREGNNALLIAEALFGKGAGI